MILRIFISILMLLVVFRLIYFIHKKFVYRKSIKHHFGYLIPLAELFAWIGLILWITNYIYQSQNYLGLIILAVLFVLLVVPVFFLIRDFIFGIYLKIQRKVDKGDCIIFEDIEGEILKAGHFSMEIRDLDGDISTIPYNRIKAKILSKHGVNPNLKKQKLTFRFSDSLETSKLIPELEKNILNTPWVAPSQKLLIQYIKSDGGEHVINVILYTLKNEYAENIRKMVEKSFKLAYT